MEIKFNDFAAIGRKFNMNWEKRSTFNSTNKQTLGQFMKTWDEFSIT